MSKLRRTVLSGVLTPTLVRDGNSSATNTDVAPPTRRASATKAATVQQTVYLTPAVHDQLRELAFSERAKMHSLILEGLDLVFRQRGMKSIADLTRR